MRHDFITYYSDIWLEDAIKQKGCKNQKEYFNKTLKDYDKKKTTTKRSSY